MQFFGTGEKPPVGIVYDTALTRIDEALAISLMFGLDGKREARVAELSLSRPSLKAAAFVDAMQRVYAGSSPFARTLPVGMEVQGKAAGPEPMFESALARPETKHEIRDVNDTADAAASIRNAFTSFHDGNCLAILSGPAVNYLKALALPRVKELAAAKVRLLAIVPYPSDVENTNKLIAAWPGEILVVPPDIGEQALFPAASIETGFSWATAPHPLIDAYKAYKPMPYDAPTTTLAAVMQAVRQKENYFKLSDPGTITLGEGGKLNLTPASGGKHRHLIFDPAQKDRLLAAYTELVTAKPVVRAPRIRPQEAKPPAAKPPADAKPQAPAPAPIAPHASN